MKTFLTMIVVGVSLALSGPAHAYTEWALDKVRKSGPGGYVSASVFFDSAGEVLWTAERGALERTLESSTRFDITATAFKDTAWVIPFTALGINPADVIGMRLASNDGSSTNFAYFAWTTHGVADVDASHTGRRRIYGVTNASRGVINLKGIEGFSPSPTLYVATGDVLAQGIQELELVIFSFTSTGR